MHGARRLLLLQSVEVAHFATELSTEVLLQFARLSPVQARRDGFPPSRQGYMILIILKNNETEGEGGQRDEGVP